MKKTVILLILAMLIGVLGSCEVKTNKQEASFLTLFDTVTTIVQYTNDKDEFSRTAELIHKELQAYHQLYDIYNDYEGVVNIKTINEKAGIMPVKVDERIIDLILMGKQYYYETDGTVNIALGAVLSIWHDYRSAGIEDPTNAKLPPIKILKQAAQHTNIEDIIVDQDKSTIFLVDAKMSLDVGAIAKGFAVEKAAIFAKQKGVENMLINVGGNVRAIGYRYDDNPWKVGIQNPEKTNKTDNLHIVDLSEQSLVTSGSYSRYYTVDGKRYHHIIDPVTLYPAQYFEAVTIICEDSGSADALSTAIYNMPYEQGLELVESLSETEALWIFPNQSQKYSSNFPLQ